MFLCVAFCLSNVSIKYSGRAFLAECKMDNEADFCALRHVASWATCGMTKVNDEATEETVISR